MGRLRRADKARRPSDADRRAAAPSPVVQAVADSDKAAQEFAKSQQKK